MSRTFIAAVALTLSASAALLAQQAPGRGTGQPPATARGTAPRDLTGYWVSIVTQDWRWRMVTPARGDFGSVPITLEAKNAADAWDPEKDKAAGEQCKPYGGAAIMSMPTRLRISWQDDNTLKVETDAGTQTRVLHFAPSKPAGGTPSWQGDSLAEWLRPRGARGPGAAGGGSLKVVTRNLRPGYLQRNGVPYSADALVTEHWDVFSDPNGSQWIGITSIVEDAKYLRQPFVTALNFRKESDGTKWEPTPCA